MNLCRSFQSVLLDQKDMCRLLKPPTTTQAGEEKRIEYYGFKAASLAGECQEVFSAFHTGKPIEDVAVFKIPINHLLDV